MKGSAIDRRMQARCFQLTLLNAFALGWFIPRHGRARYEEITLGFYKAKIEYFAGELARYLEGERASPFAKAVSRSSHEA